MFKNTLFMKFFIPDTELFISDFGKMLLEYKAMVKSAKPSNWGLYEPTKKFDAHFSERLNAEVEKDEFVPELQHLNWKIRKNPEALGGFSAARMLANNAPLHMIERLYLRLTIDEEKTFAELYQYFKYRLQHNQADYAFIEYMTYPRMLDYVGIHCCDGHHKETKEPHMIVTTHELRHWLPNLPWLAYFGKPYVELFGEEKLAHAPVYRVDKIGEGYLLQLTEHISDMEADYESYRAKEQSVKSYLHPNAFYSREKGYSLDILKAHLEKYTIPKPGSVFATPEFTDLRQGLAKRGEQPA